MKKIISIVSIGTVLITGVSSAVSCASRPIESIKGDSNKVVLDTHTYYDVMRWSSDVISNSNYKKHFLDNLNNTIKNGGSLDYAKLVAYDKNNKSLITSVIDDYQSTTNIGAKISDDDIAKDLKFSIYGIKNDKDNTPYFVESIGGSTSKNKIKDDTPELVPTYNSKTDVYTLHFEVGVEATKVDNNEFLGARYNIKKDAKDKLTTEGSISTNDLGKNYYSTILNSYDKLDKKSKANLAISKNSDGSYLIGNGEDFNYMFEIQFYFKLS